MKVKLIKLKSSHDDSKIHSLTLGAVYDVLGIQADYYRIIDENDHEPYLYPNDCFQIIDDSIPAFWETEYGEDNERYSGLPSWNQVGFFEDYFDNIQEIRDQFWRDYQTYYGKNSS